MFPDASGLQVRNTLFLSQLARPLKKEKLRNTPRLWSEHKRRAWTLNKGLTLREKKNLFFLFPSAQAMQWPPAALAARSE